MMKIRLIVLNVILLLILSCNTKSIFDKSENEEESKVTQLPRSHWMEGKYGLMVHWLAPGPLPQSGAQIKDLNKAVDAFNLEAFMADFDQTGAEWLIFTIGQNSGNYASPNITIDSLAGKGHTSNRDLVLEIAQAIKKRGKRFIAYLPCEIRANESMHKGFAWNTQSGTDQAKFQQLYLKVIREWAIRFGKNLDGWWFDGCYTWEAFPNKYMKWEEWYNAARAGNPDAALAFNDGSYLVSSIKPIVPEHDFLSGEQLVIIDGKLRLGLKKEGYKLYLPETAYVEGTTCLNHTLLPIDAYWSRGSGICPDWGNFPFKAIYTSTPDGMEPPAYSDDQLQQFVKNYTLIGGAVTLNVGIFQEGHIGKMTLTQLTKLKENYIKWK